MEEKPQKNLHLFITMLLTIVICAIFLITLAYIITLPNSEVTATYDGDPLLFLIIFIVLAIISLIILTIKICKFKKSHSKFGIILSSIFLAYCIGGIIFISVGRKAKNEDVYINVNQEISLNMNFDIRSYKDIDDLEITFIFKDKNNRIFSQKVKKIGDVKRGSDYTVTIKFTEFNITEIMKIDKVSAYVTGGRTSYITSI